MSQWREGPLHLDGRWGPASEEDELRFLRAGLSEDEARKMLAFWRDFDGLWTAMIECKSCAGVAFRLLRTPDDLDVTKSRYGTPAGNGRHRAECCNCGASMLVFDQHLHGWNAALCGERDSLDVDYAAIVDPHLASTPCPCGAQAFEVLVTANFDAEDIDELAPGQQRESFGAFSGWSRCTSCGRGTCFIECECA